MAETSSEILKRLHAYHALPIDLSLRESYFRLLERLGDPHRKLPPVIHVAGTNGKGSVIAFLRAMLEAAGRRVHVYTSPHLLRFHERIRLAGELIGEKQLVSLLRECEAANAAGPVTSFEITTALAFLAFARASADILLLETGMGGRLDATNIVPAPALCVITHLSMDHAEYLGGSLAKIAVEKAGIFRPGITAAVAPQTSTEALAALEKEAAGKSCPLFLHGRDWNYRLEENGFIHSSAAGEKHYPPPSLAGVHQYENAATAIAALEAFSPFAVPDEARAQGLCRVEWPARLQRLKSGPLVSALPEGCELWLDGGHNAMAGEALAAQAKAWTRTGGKKLMLIFGMLATKQPDAFLASLARHVSALAAVAIPQEAQSLSAGQAADAARRAGLARAESFSSLPAALDFCLRDSRERPARILITGSLSLAGHVLRDHD